MKIAEKKVSLAILDTDILNIFFLSSFLSFFFFSLPIIEITAWPKGKIGLHTPAAYGLI